MYDSSMSMCCSPLSDRFGSGLRCGFGLFDSKHIIDWAGMKEDLMTLERGLLRLEVAEVTTLHCWGREATVNSF